MENVYTQNCIMSSNPILSVSMQCYFSRVLLDAAYLIMVKNEENKDHGCYSKKAPWSLL